MQIVSRSGWGATAPLGSPMPGVAREVWLHHSVTPVTADPRADMRVIERVGVERFGRFSYSWAVHPTGTVLEGAGVTIGAHTGGRNSTSFGVVLIGNYDDLAVTDPQMASTAGLIRWLIATGKLQPGTYPTGGHRDLKATSCPGARAYPRIGELRRLVANPEEDDMPLDSDDRKFITDAVNDATFNNARRVVQVLGGGQGNTLLGGQDWAPGLVTLPKVLAAVAQVDGAEVDETALAAAVVAALPITALAQAIAERLPADDRKALLDELAARLAE